MKEKIGTIEYFIYLAIFIFAASIRLIGLGNIPLSENEAYIANQTLKFLSNQTIETVTPLTISFTAILFTIFGVSTFWVRFFPAILGSILTILPLFWKEKLGKINALIMASILSFDPLFVAASRKVDSPIIPVFFFAILILCIDRKNWIATSIVFANLLLSGHFAIIIILTVLFLSMILFLKTKSLKEYSISINYIKLLLNLLIFITSYFLIASIFGAFPQGISNAIENLFIWTSGWGIQKISIIKVLIALPIYSPLILVFGSIGIFYSIKSNQKIGLLFSLYSAITMCITFINPNREIFDLILVTLPLSFLSTVIIVQSIKSIEKPIVSTILSMSLILFGFFMYFNIASIAKNNYSFESNQFYLQIAIIAVILVLMILSVMMVVAGWSNQIASKGVIWAFVFLFGFYSFAIGWRGAHNSQKAQAELWNTSLSANQIQMFNQIIQDMAKKISGVDTEISIANRVDSQSILWEIKNYSKDDLSSTDFLITPKNSNIQIIEEDYRGQSFFIQSYPVFQTKDVDELLDWLMFRDISYYQQEIILWVPQNLFE